ncbi:unnamed protein product [Echinostoma caproni]|uniref:RPAP1_N domain-containing protein n=1 Tax=Echinostoma caproni TaxID=27848 RepID=A0A183B8I3_9TREM|nr:unnamed protein product [Echinostoma caproni]
MEETPLLPPDLVDSESDEEFNKSPTLSPGSMHEEEIKPVSTYCDSGDEERSPQSEGTKNKMGRWSLSKGAAKKPSKSKVRVVSEEVISEGTQSQDEINKVNIHSETQRLLREAEIHIPEHRPKQFKSFTEFRQSLRGIASIASQVVEETETRQIPHEMTAAEDPEEIKNSSNLGISEPIEQSSSAPVDASVPNDTQNGTHLLPDQSQTPDHSNESVSTNRPSKFMGILSLLPAALPPLNRPSEDEGFVDLGEFGKQRGLLYVTEQSLRCHSLCTLQNVFSFGYYTPLSGE